jgi:zinc D-Ala-D-Ala carboxypeptidase
MNLTEHFTLAEMTHSQKGDRLGLDNTPTEVALQNLIRTAKGLEGVRVRLGRRPISVSSGYRSPAVNKAVGGAKRSQHITGEAVDFICPSYGTPEDIVANIVDMDYDQLILEFANNGGGWVHISFSDNNRNEALIIDESGVRPY